MAVCLHACLLLVINSLGVTRMSALLYQLSLCLVYCVVVVVVFVLVPRIEC